MHNKCKLFVLGPNGMLGQMVCAYFGHHHGFHVVPLDARFDTDRRHEFEDVLTRCKNGFVINCIGKINQKKPNPHEIVWANSLLPLELNNFLPSAVKLIHASTDCVFSGNKGLPYEITDIPDATDNYGWSKRLGEVALQDRKNTYVVRVSIIGPDKSDDPRGLLGWFLSEPPGSRLKGYVNHIWNGITTLEWCKQIEKNFLNSENKVTDGSPIHLGVEKALSKYELLKLFQYVFQTDYEIKPEEYPVSADKRLVPQIVCPPLEQQVDELATFCREQRFRQHI